jgi:hypothetical protein
MDPNRLKEIPIFSHLSNEEAKRLAAFATETTVADATGSDAASGMGNADAISGDGGVSEHFVCEPTHPR